MIQQLFRKLFVSGRKHQMLSESELLNHFLEYSGRPPLILGDGSIITRDLAAEYNTLFRCVTLISSIIADMVSNTIHVRDWDGNRVRNTGRWITRFRDSPDDMIPAHTWLEDYVSDYILSGNAICVRTEGAMLQRINPDTASPRETNYGIVYQGEQAYLNGGATEMYPISRVIHSRWGHFSSKKSGTPLNLFARAPISSMGKSIALGMETDRWVRNYFDSNDGASKSDMVVTYPEEMPVDMQDKFMAALRKYSQGRKPMALFGNPSVHNLKQSPQDADALKLREFQVREVARFLGVPAPLLGENVTQWGEGIEQLARLFWKFSVKGHLFRILKPFSWKLLPEGHEFAVDETELLRGDAEALSKIIIATKGSTQAHPIMSRREQRSLLGIDPEWPEGEPELIIQNQSGNEGNNAREDQTN